MFRLLLITITLIFSVNLFSENKTVARKYRDRTLVFVLSEDNAYGNKKPNPVFQLFRKKQKLNKKITAAVLAFPFPFGMVGLHRIYLGTKPFVPVAYIASLGGVFGILPFVDFCAITFDKDFDQYRDNGKVFMWLKD